MINLEKLEDSFSQIGTSRIPVFIDIYLASTKSFIHDFEKFYKKRQTDYLYDLVHKVRGSTVNFYDTELDNILINLENNLLQSPLLITDEDVSLLKTKFNQFSQELASLKSKYRK
ncbi:MAG: hypothetical protein RAO94_13165 [Candidatus Stygibacter australis]|nr:hypothetical protein [Candidatus Stygibacter australis]MDP8323292.1 hypothetical protein [Candidatus Stygibacter australis]